MIGKTLVLFLSVCAPLQSHAEPAEAAHNHLAEHEAARLQFCQVRGLQPRTGRRPKIWDTFIVNLEADLLEIRFHETAAYVDHFVVVESAVSTTGHPKRTMFDEIRPRFALFEDKLVYVKLADAGDETGATTWSRESFVRNQLTAVTTLQGIEDGDVVIVSDADEILRPDILRSLVFCQGYDGKRMLFNMKLYYYSFNLVHKSTWGLVKGFVYNSSQPLPLANDVRGYQSMTHTFADCGWHCSCCFPTISMIRNKIRSYGHAENTDNKEIQEREWIVNVVRKGLDLYGRASETYSFIEPEDVPKYVSANAVRFSYLLDRRAPSAGFSDFLD